MSLPYGQQQQQQPQPMPTSTPQLSTTHSGRGSVGPVIAVLAVITVLGMISAMIGRLCAGRRIPGLGQYDLEGWFERKFAPCIDGRIGPPPIRVLPPNANGTGASSVPIVIPAEATTQEMKHSEPQSTQSVSETAES